MPISTMAHTVLIEPLSSSLSTWGSKALLHDGLAFAKTEPISFGTHFREPEDMTTLLLNVVFVLVCLTLLFICLLSNGDGFSDELADGDATTLHRSAFGDSDGCWAQAFRDATGPDRDALELLFRCHIISTYEFAESKVSKEHIDESIWIGSYMLRQKPLAEWVSVRYLAKQSFEDHAAMCSLARSESRPNRPRLQSSQTSTSEQVTPLHSFARMDVPSSAESHLSCASLPPMQMPRSDSARPGLTPQKSASVPGLPMIRTPDFPGSADAQQKASARPQVQIPRMDLSSLRKQSSNDDDDDPYTTRDRECD